MLFGISVRSLLVALGLVATTALAQPCLEKNLQYWQAFPPGGESDLSARHQQAVLRKKCAAIETIVQYKAGAGGALMWSQMNNLPGDGFNVVGINLPHIVFQPIEGQVQYKTADITPVFWFHYTPDTLVVPTSSGIKNFAEFIEAAKKDPGKLSLGGSGLNSANHAAHERLNAAFGIKTIYVPFKGTGDMTTSVLGGQVDGAMTYVPFVVANKTRVRPLAVAMDKRHPLIPDVPTFKELGWPAAESGTWQGVLVQGATPPAMVERLSRDLRAAMAVPSVAERITTIGGENRAEGPESFRRWLDNEIEVWGRVVRANNIKLD